MTVLGYTGQNPNYSPFFVKVMMRVQMRKRYAFPSTAVNLSGCFCRHRNFLIGAQVKKSLGSRTGSEKPVFITKTRLPFNAICQGLAGRQNNMYADMTGKAESMRDLTRFCKSRHICHYRGT
jgi:hypothetical protein